MYSFIKQHLHRTSVKQFVSMTSSWIIMTSSCKKKINRRKNVSSPTKILISATLSSIRSHLRSHVSKIITWLLGCVGKEPNNRFCIDGPPTQTCTHAPDLVFFCFIIISIQSSKVKGHIRVKCDHSSLVCTYIFSALIKWCAPAVPNSFSISHILVTQSSPRKFRRWKGSI